MDLDIIQTTKEGEIVQFLRDVRDYFKASLATSEYENTSNMFYLTAADTTEQLLNRCESLLNLLKSKNQNLLLKPHKSQSNNNFSPLQTVQTKNHQWHDTGNTNSNNNDENKQSCIGEQLLKREIDNEDVSYLDMSTPHYNNNTRETSTGNKVDLNSSKVNEKTFRCSTLVVTQNKSFLHRLHDTTTIAVEDETGAKKNNGNSEADKKKNYADDAQIYDICQVTTQGSDGEEDEIELEETQKVITQNSHFSLPNIDCPYLDLPAGHLSIKKSIKYGQLMKIEKRLFFDQSKKCYCGILDDWLLCYADGPTSNRPTISLYLKIPGIEIEHFGDGKRRDVCFQITTCDPNKRFVFQAVNEIDAKEWIHAIEAAIRNDLTGTEVKNSPTRKLPTPPPMKKVTFLNSFKGGSDGALTNDCIYEEPSPIHNITTKFQKSPEKRPELPHKQNNPFVLARKFEYDVPKCPPQPLQTDDSGNVELLINPYENNESNSPAKTYTITLSESLYLASSPATAQNLNLKLEENLDFQAKVKDVHSKLTSQLPNGPNIKKSLKKTLSSGQNGTESNTLPSPTSSSSPLTESLELKKQKKTSNPSNSPQKSFNEKSSSFAKNWFLNRLNKNTSSTRSNSSSSSSSSSSSPSKCKQSEKENLLNSSPDVCDGYEVHLSSLASNPVFPISLKSSSPNNGTSKVNMIINQLEASGHLASMFNTDTVATFSSFCDNDFNNYEPIMTVSTPPTNLMKKV